MLDQIGGSLSPVLLDSNAKLNYRHGCDITGRAAGRNTPRPAPEQVPCRVLPTPHLRCPSPPVVTHHPPIFIPCPLNPLPLSLRTARLHPAYSEPVEFFLAREASR